MIEGSWPTKAVEEYFTSNKFLYYTPISTKAIPRSGSRYPRLVQAVNHNLQIVNLNLSYVPLVNTESIILIVFHRSQSNTKLSQKCSISEIGVRCKVNFRLARCKVADHALNDFKSYQSPFLVSSTAHRSQIKILFQILQLWFHVILKISLLEAKLPILIAISELNLWIM